MSGGINRSHLSLSFESYYRKIILKDGITAADLRMGNDGLGNLVIDVMEGGDIAETIFIASFEDGKTITGVAQATRGGYFSFMGDAGSEYTITRSAPDGTTVGFGIGSTGAMWLVEADVSVTYFLDTLVVDGRALNLRGGVPVWGSDAGEDLRGFAVKDATGQAYADRMEGRGGDDRLGDVSVLSSNPGESATTNANANTANANTADANANTASNPGTNANSPAGSNANSAAPAVNSAANATTVNAPAGNSTTVNVPAGNEPAKPGSNK